MASNQQPTTTIVPIQKERIITYVSLDTKDRTVLTDDPFSCQINMPSPIVGNIKSISLCSLELPLNFNQIRAPYNTFTFVVVDKNNTNSSFTIKSNYFTLTVQEGNYNMNTLVTAMNTQLSFYVTNDTTNVPHITGNSTGNLQFREVFSSLYLTYDPTNNQIQLIGTVNNTTWTTKMKQSVSNPSGTFMYSAGLMFVPNYFNSSSYSLYTPFFDLSTIIGFSNYSTTSLNTRYNNANGNLGISAFGRSGNIYFDTYFSIVFPNLTSKTLGTTPCFFRVPINVASGSVYYWSENQGFVQEIQTNIKSLSYIKMRLVDRYNNIMNNNGVDFSFLIRVETEES